MKNIFIFSSPYIIRTLLYNLAYVLNQSINTVYILSEIVNQCEAFDLLNIPNITAVNSLENGLSLCDTVIIVRDETLCLRSIDFILSYADANGKRCVDVPSPIDNTTIGHSIDSDFYSNKEVPTILVIENGDCAQTYYTEILLLYELSRHKLKIHIHPSLFTSVIFNTLHENMSLNPALYSTAHEEADVLLFTVFKNPFLHSDILSLSQTIDLLNPDFIIMTTNDEFVLSDELYRWFEVIYGRKLNALIKSQYISVRLSEMTRLSLYRNIHTEAPYNCIDQYNFLIQRLFAAVSIPDGVSVISLVDKNEN